MNFIPGFSFLISAILVIASSNTVTSDAPFARDMAKVTTCLPPAIAMDFCSLKPSVTSATSASLIERPPPRLICVWLKANASTALPRTRTDWREPAICDCPPDALIFCWRSTALIWLALTPSDCIFAGSSTTRISRFTPPLRLTDAMPSTESNRRATVSSTNQLSCSSVMSLASTAK